MSERSAPPRSPIAVLAVLSGTAGLVYEVVWAKQMAQLIGASGPAHAAVLAGFLGGLAAGSLVLGRRAQAAASPLSFYARLELLVAAGGMLAPLLLRLAPEPARLPLFSAAALASAFAMGGALPALVGGRGGSARLELSLVYGANCLGAALGALLSDFALIPRLGLTGASHAAAGVNLAASAWAALEARRRAAHPFPWDDRKFVPAPDVLPAVVVFLAVFLSGYAALLCETAWIRLLSLVAGSSVYSFSTMLAALILGLAAGARLCGPAERRFGPAGALALALAGAGLGAAAGLPLAERLPYLFMRLARRVGPESFHAFEAAKLAFSFAALLPAALFFGLALPAAGRCLGGGRPGESSGRLLAANTFGCVLGAGAGLWLLPRLGLEGLLRAAALSQWLAAAIVWAGAGELAPRRLRRAAALAALGLAVLAALPRWDRRLLSQGGFRAKSAVAPSSFEQFRALIVENSALPFHRDGASATVAVLQYGMGLRSLRINGKPDASNGRDLRTQILLARLPLLLRPQAERVLVVGWGSGVSVAAALGPGRRVDAVEISPEVVAASRLFSAENEGVLEDPRVSVHLADAKAFLRRGAAAYDLIVSEPSNPWMAGVGGLFSREFYADAKRRLAPGGVMAQWCHLYEMDDETLRLVLRTFVDAFPSTTLWTMIGSDLLLIGSQQPLRPAAPALEAEFRDPRVRAWFLRAGLLTPAGALSLQSGSETAARELAGTGPLNTDDRPILEYAAPKAYFRDSFAALTFTRDGRADPKAFSDLLLGRYLAQRGRALSADEYEEILLFPRALPEMPALSAFVREWRHRSPREAERRLAKLGLSEVMVP